MLPLAELLFDHFGDGIQRREVLVVEAETARELPDPFDWIEFRAVRWKEIEFESSGHVFPPAPVKARMVVLRVVRDHHHPSPCGGGLVSNLTGKREEGLGVEFAGLLAKDEFAVPEPDGAKVSDALSGREMPEDRVFRLGRDPHTTAGAVLLEMDLVGGPEVYGRHSHQRFEFFLWAA